MEDKKIVIEKPLPFESKWKKPLGPHQLNSIAVVDGPHTAVECIIDELKHMAIFHPWYLITIIALVAVIIGLAIATNQVYVTLLLVGVLIAALGSSTVICKLIFKDKGNKDERTEKNG